ncbi:hypothetical protein Cdeb_00341 [Caldibacillus debilis GB1]|uniref:Uncharacterized protein n=1 Tax=Caldibacillus debilis GB1 TaxID=1339248 RepID=A0A420VGX3_9BACI|nr:hypothetical protein Cdeb_00341 [Caldibacillus debilis GB1]
MECFQGSGASRTVSGSSQAREITTLCRRHRTVPYQVEREKFLRL